LKIYISRGIATHYKLFTECAGEKCENRSIFSEDTLYGQKFAAFFFSYLLFRREQFGLPCSYRRLGLQFHLNITH